MKKSEQITINSRVLEALNRFYSSNVNIKGAPQYKLRSCSAVVLPFQEYYALKSYNTIVAIIDRRTDTLYDFLRYAYGYTATSARHVSKFEHDYSDGKWSCTNRYTYREV